MRLWHSRRRAFGPGWRAIGYSESSPSLPKEKYGNAPFAVRAQDSSPAGGKRKKNLERTLAHRAPTSRGGARKHKAAASKSGRVSPKPHLLRAMRPGPP